MMNQPLRLSAMISRWFSIEFPNKYRVIRNQKFGSFGP